MEQELGKLRQSAASTEKQSEFPWLYLAHSFTLSSIAAHPPPNVQLQVVLKGTRLPTRETLRLRTSSTRSIPSVQQSGSFVPKIVISNRRISFPISIPSRPTSYLQLLPSLPNRLAPTTKNRHRSPDCRRPRNLLERRHYLLHLSQSDPSYYCGKQVSFQQLLGSSICRKSLQVRSKEVQNEPYETRGSNFGQRRKE